MSKVKEVEAKLLNGKASVIKEFNDTIVKMRADPNAASSLSLYGVEVDALLKGEQKLKTTVVKNDSCTSDIEQYCKMNNIGKEGEKFLTELKQIHR